MDWNKFSHQFDESWHNIIKPFIESEECNKIYAFLKKNLLEERKLHLILLMYLDVLKKQNYQI